MYVSDYNLYLEQDAQVDKILIEYINKLRMFNIEELLKNRKEAEKIIKEYILLANYPTFYDGKQYISSLKFEDIKNIEAKIWYILHHKSLNIMTVDDYYNNTLLRENIKLISRYYTIFIHRNEEYRSILNKYHKYIESLVKLRELNRIQKLEEKRIELENRKKQRIIEEQKFIEKLERKKYIEENNTFRDKDITINTKITGNMKTFVLYDNKEYKFDDFLIAMYPNERVNKSVVYFRDTIDNLLKVGPTQRIKMKYDILAHHFGLPIISDEDKDDLFRFLNKYYDNETIQKYYRRFKWDNGIEKMVAFGADLGISGKVDGAIDSFWCYEYRIDSGKAIITGIDTSFSLWLAGIKASICSVFATYVAANRIPNNKQIEEIKNNVLISLYYQQGKRSAIPDIQIGRPIKEIINNCIDTVYRKINGKKSIDISDTVNKCFSTLSIPDYQSESYQFSVDFEKDVMIVDTKSAARAQQAIEQVYTVAAERLTGLKAGDKITTQQLRDRGYKNNNGKAINTLVEYGILQKGVFRGSYIMLKDF
ncbi:hypothetical protein [uncultured Brachyspira sp.]|uniref:hypothetical protein n=1 Tax=uncultured Brachyspira sp. TaxID=221953 RepID=UPI00260D4415|nr:hypothetical protein [uncultured Brachyspira sp.]